MPGGGHGKRTGGMKMAKYERMVNGDCYTILNRLEQAVLLINRDLE